MQWTRPVYQRDLIPPKELTLSIELISQEADGSAFTLKFAVDQTLRKTDPEFETDLLYNLNILQENVAAIDIFASTASLDDYLQTVRVDWEILPPGTVDQVMAAMLQGKRAVSLEKQRVMRERLQVLRGLNPRNYIAGTNGFLRYFGAQFGDDLVVFESLNYGSAIYAMFENWNQLSQRSRVDLLKGPREGFERIAHLGNWEGRLRVIVREYLERQRKQQPRR